MTTRRLNYTGTKRIRQTDIEVIVDRAEEGISLDASFRLADYSLPETAEVVLEAYLEWNVMRFDFGTVGMQRAPESLLLTQFDNPADVLFRLKVLGTGDQLGLILAEADRIKPSDLSHREDARSFVAVRSANLGAVVWRVTFEPQPVLEVNDRLGDWQSFVRRSAVKAFVLPEVVRQVLKQAIENEDEDENAWQYSAMKLAPIACGPVPRSEDEEEVEAWIDEVVRKFAHRFRLWRGITEFIGQESVE